MFSALLVCALAPSASAQILETHADSLTSYLGAKSAVQNAKPRPEQRGANHDGSPRAGSTHSMAIAGNPFENAWRGETSVNGVALDTGVWSTSDVDLAFPANVPWRVGRYFNHRQTDGGSLYAADSAQGKNWFQSSMPELVLYDDADNAKDVLYLVFGADRYAEYKRTGSSSTEFKGVNGAAGRIKEHAGTPDTYELLDQRGWRFHFIGFDAAKNGAKGQLWKVVNPAGDTAFVGDASVAADAVTNGFDANGKLLYAFDSSDRRITYAWNADSTPHISQVKVETKSGGTWSSPSGVVEVGRVEYAYYGNESFGDEGDLKTVKVTLPLTDSGVSDVRVKYYRYWEGTFNSTTNPGHPHSLKLVLDDEGARRYDWADSTFDEDFLTETTDNLKPYAAAYLEYDSSQRVAAGWFNGKCGCSGAGSGTFEFRYETSGYTNTSGYDTAWARRASVERPDGSWLTQYFDELGQPLHRVITDGDPAGTSPAPSRWADSVTRDSSGRVERVGAPSALDTSSYSHSSGTVSTSASTGLVWDFTRTGSGDLTGFLSTVRFRTAGTGGSAYYDRAVSWTSASEAVASGGGTVVRPLVTADKRYRNAQTTQEVSEELYSSVSQTTVSSKVALAEVSTTAQAVATANNGANSSTDSSAQHLTTAGHVDFAKDRDGAITYREYTHGQVTKEVEDANTSSLSPPTGFSHTGAPLNLVTLHAYDAQGRRTTTTHPDGRVTQSYYSRLADRRRVTLEFPKYDSGTGKRYGPVRYSVTNHAGQVEASGVIALAGNESTSALTAYIDESDADAITAVDVGSVAQLRTSLLDASGTQVSEERAYFAIPTSLPGTDGAHYDATKFGYDELGRRRRVKEAHGTVTRTVYDARGNVTARWTGTVDSSFPGGEAGTDNMVKVEELTFDGGADGGNGHLTKRTLFVQDSATGKRETSYFHDARGRVIATVNPTAPHTVSSYDNLGRVTATAQYSSSSGLGASSAPTSATNRLAYSETFYDERGQVWKSVRHKINASTGASDDSLETLSWFDGAGRLRKRDGEQLEKFGYGRLGRQTHHFVLASDNDSTYSHALDVAGDIVLEERQTTYEDDGLVVMEASIARLYDDAGTGETTGALDTNADSDTLAYTAANVLGRIQITARWYDDFDRLVDVVQYGTNDATANVGTFDRDGLSVPARADDKLRTTYEFNTDGTLKQTTDPKGLITRYEYDALGRQTAVIANYVDGTAGGGTNGDEDQIVRYGYTDGLQTSITADLPSPETDQVTRYYFGTKKGTPAASKLASGHLLRAVKYPDSTNAAPEPTSSSGVDYIDATSDADVVGFAFNAQGQEIWRKDQAGGVIETTFDDAGRQTARAVTTLASGFDGAVRRIETAYDSLGRTETVTQYDAASAGNVVDQVKNVFDGWGNLTNFRQDLDSTVGGSGYWEVAYAYSKATTGRNTVRRTSVTLPGGATYGFNYRGGASHDSEASRVSSVTDAFDTDLADYEYIGAGQVVRTNLDEVGIFSKAYTGSGTTFGRLDRFNRTLISSWTRDLSTDRDIYKVTLGYDRNSNITSQDDAVHTGHDVAYANDGLNRLIDADEGTLSGGSIGSRTRRQQWTLNQTGNWNRDKVDLNGDGDFLDAGELDDTRTHNVVNELTARDTNSSSPAEHSFAYDAAGNMTDDGAAYTYEWDAFYRLRKVRNRSTSALVSEYWYNGLGFLVTRHQDTDADGDVDGSDQKYHTAYDERWRQVATFRGSDSSPKEQFVYHCAGNGGWGGSSYIDSVLLRDRDMTNGWTGAADGTLEERIYLLQNWRADVVAIVEPDGEEEGGAVMLEWIKYSAYGVPFALPAGDTNSDGVCDSTDDAQVTTWKNAPVYDVRGDLNLDGVIDADDETLVAGAHQSLGRGVLTSTAVGNRKGYAGYEGDAKLSAKWHVRHRVLDSVLGRWLRRDPLGYVDGISLHHFVHAGPIRAVDPDGQLSWSAGSSGGAPTEASQSQNPWNIVDNETRANCCLTGFNNGASGGDAGGWVCCGGSAVPCYEWYNWSGAAASPIIDACIKQHEGGHVGDVDQNACIAAANGTRVPWTDPYDTAGNNASERALLTQELSCLNASSTDGLSSQEREDIRERKAILVLAIRQTDFATSM